MSSKRHKVLVLDASSFIGGFNPQFADFEQYTVPEVLDEVKTRRAKFVLDVSILSGKVKVLSPEDEYVEIVKREARNTGDLWKLDATDIKLLALALKLKRERNVEPIIVSDDYAIQNVARRLSVDFTPVAYSGIKEEIQWRLYCPFCKRQYPSDYSGNICPECGGELKRKVAWKKRINKQKDD
ncbi:MAG: NOB1 family endonuclease [Candidatus Baldrarchaeia archaeon]